MDNFQNSGDMMDNYFMLDPAIIADTHELRKIRHKYIETYGLDKLGMSPRRVHRNLNPDRKSVV